MHCIYLCYGNTMKTCTNSIVSVRELMQALLMELNCYMNNFAMPTQRNIFFFLFIFYTSILNQLSASFCLFPHPEPQFHSSKGVSFISTVISTNTSQLRLPGVNKKKKKNEIEVEIQTKPIRETSHSEKLTTAAVKMNDSSRRVSFGTNCTIKCLRNGAADTSDEGSVPSNKQAVGRVASERW